MTEVTLSPSALCHYIADDELAGLNEMNSDPVKDICLAAIGGFLGAIIPAFDGLRRFGDATHPMTKTDLASLFVAIATFSVMAVTAFLWRRKSKVREDAVAAIRARRNG